MYMHRPITKTQIYRLRFVLVVGEYSTNLRSTVIHVEGGTAGDDLTSEFKQQQMAKNKAIFWAKWARRTEWPTDWPISTSLMHGLIETKVYLTRSRSLISSTAKYLAHHSADCLTRSKRSFGVGFVPTVRIRLRHLIAKPGIK